MRKVVAGCLLGLGLLCCDSTSLGLEKHVAVSSGRLSGETSKSSAEQQNSNSPDLSGTASTRKLTFSVASIRQSVSGGNPTSNVPLTTGDSYLPVQERFSAKNQPAFVYILFAYKVQLNEMWGLLNRLPKWAVSDRFDIQARIEQSNPSKDQIREMMRSLLEERFSLRVHRETVRRDVLGLEIKGTKEMKGTKFGPQLQRSKSGEPCSGQEVLSHEQVLAATPAKLLGSWPVLCEGDQIELAQHTRAGARNQGMDAIAAWLTGEGDTDLSIVNMTGLNGTFDLILDFAPEHGPMMTDSPFPTFAQAVQDQLGLVLKKQMGTATVFVVDHIERPSGN